MNLMRLQRGSERVALTEISFEQEGVGFVGYSGAKHMWDYLLPAILHLTKFLDLWKGSLAFFTAFFPSYFTCTCAQLLTEI